MPTLWAGMRTKGGPAPLCVNPAQAQAGLVALAKAFLVVLAIVGVVVNKLADETCQENLLGFFVSVAAVCLLSSGLFLHLSMKSIAADTEWRLFLLAAVLMTIAESLIAGWGFVLWLKSSALVSVKQCVKMSSLNVCEEFQKLGSPDDCPGKINNPTGDPNIDCELDFLCRFQAPSTFAMGAVVSLFVGLIAHVTSWVVFVKFLPSIAVQGRELISDSLN
jgi:hypothetical protein